MKLFYRRRQHVGLSDGEPFHVIAILGNVAELVAGRMEETIGETSLRDATIGTGVAIDKILALTGQMPAVNIANIWMPTKAERQANYETDHKLDQIVARLMPVDEGGRRS